MDLTMDRLVENLISDAPNGQESDYGSSPWIEIGAFQSPGGFIPSPYLTAQPPFSETSWPMATPTLSKPQTIPIQPLHTTPAPSALTPRRTLTDDDRRRMCMYHEENKSAKQTDIGALFGVERSTVSKILRQKDKYLSMDGGRRFPIKRNKGKAPDIEKTLANWARKHQRQGFVLTHALIKEKVHLFAATCPCPDEKQKILAEGWLKEFMQKNHLPACNSRKNSADTIASEDGESRSPRRQENIKEELGNNAFHFSRDSAKHDHSSTLDTIPSLSTGVTSPTLPLVSESPRAPTVHSRRPSISSATGGPLSQTFAGDAEIVNGNGEKYSSTNSNHSTDGPLSGTVLDSPLDENLDERNLIDTCDVSLRNSMRHHESSADLKSIGNSMQPPHMPPGTLTQDEARQALELVMNYIQSRPSGLELDIQDYITIGTLMGKLDVVRNNQAISRCHIDEDTDSLQMT